VSGLTPELAGQLADPQNARVQRWLINAPLWVTFLAVALPCGAAFTLVLGLQGLSWIISAVVGAWAGALYGCLVAPIVERNYRSVREAMAGLSPEDWKTALRATWRGPAPEEPATRAAAAWIVGDQLAQVRRRRTPFLIGYSLVVLLAIYLAVVQWPWFWAAVPIVGAMFVLALQAPRALERRLAILGEAVPQT
jgi:hypothetical protein